ncbi:hypothetical protein AKI39_13975 [Bordetella sp. H567]|uniref:putative adhesin n=1 Tax=Bordetella sp. H567 TaxID=1697043 RepID=UPI00081CED0E|nr:hypothetical protein [Bordetella sp. H567]AOB31557.1 hypothetical protein AKI39_13975 [Bordetella sp. H567]
MPNQPVFKPRITSHLNTHPSVPRPPSYEAYFKDHFPAQPLPDGKYIRTHPLHYGRYILWKGTRNADLIISSHGSRSLAGERNRYNPEFKNLVPPGMALHFYGPDYAPISTFNIHQAFMNDKVIARPYEIKSDGQAYVDYALSKFQGPPESYDKVRNCLPLYDIVTIEQASVRGPSDHVMLSELIKDLLLKGHRYTRIHCFFCRSLSKSAIAKYPELAKLVKPVYRVP